jgi:ATP-binding cassette subfamily F protein uup
LAVTDEPPARAAPGSKDTRERPVARKLSYKLQRELDALPDQIAELEQAVADLRSIVGDTAFYQRPHQEVQQTLAQLQSAEREVELAVERWSELEQQATDVAGRDAD